jgi:hypothetical protein
MPRSTKKPVANTKPVLNPVVQNSLPVNQQPSLFSSVKQGFGFGIGSSIAHNIFDSKPAQPQQPQQPQQPLYPVIDKITEFKQCMEKTYNNYEECGTILK